MRPAAVGYQCPEEVAEARRSAPRVRAPMGGREGTLAGRITPALIGLCVLAFVAEGFPIAGPPTTRFADDYFLSGVGLYQHEYYRLITAGFLHYNIFHILVNMYSLYVLGYQLERIVGWWRYLTLFLLSVVGGNVLVYLVDGLQASALGASTGIFGLLSAYYLVARKVGAQTGQILGLIALNLVISVSFRHTISLWGHVGGLVTGAIVGAVLVYIPPKRWQLQAGALVLIAAALVFAAIVRTSTISLPPGLQEILG
jgi:membrane associated rhomboid family serine protease